MARLCEISTVAPSQPMRMLIAVAIAPMPQRLKRFAMGRLLGAHIDRSARIGLSIVDSDVLEMGPGSRIGHLTMLRGLRRTHLGAGASVGNLNWITASPVFRTQSPRNTEHGCFTLGRESAVTSRHYVDCSGGVMIGEYTTVAGVRSTILSHEIDLLAGVQTSTATHIGNFCFVSSNVCLTAGSSIPDRSAVAMGAVVVGDLETSGALYGGVPARLLRSGIDAGAYFRRRKGFVGTKRDDGQTRGLLKVTRARHAVIRVLRVISSLDPGMGGPSVTALNSAIAVRAPGVRTEIAVVVRAGDTSAPWWQEVESRCRREGIRVHAFPALASRFAPRKYNLSMALARWLGSRAGRRYDIVHADSPWTGGCGVASLIASMGTVPLVISPHEVFTPFDMSHGSVSIRMAKRVGTEFYRRAADLIVCSSPLELHDTRASGFPSEKLACIYHPVVDERAPMMAPKPPDPDRNGLRVGYIGRLHRKKNVDLIIEAVGRLGDQISLLIAGTGDQQLEAALRRRVDRVLAHRARFVGWVSDDDKSTFFSKIDVLVMPSMYECFGVAAIEALAAGVPVVVSDQVGIADIVRRHHAGSVVAPTIDAIAGALRRYVDDPDSRISDARHAQPAALADASFATYGAEIMAHYQRLLEARA